MKTNFQVIERTVDKSGWKVIKYDNAQGGDGNKPENVTDNNPNTIWHTDWNGSEFPHEIVIDFGQPYRVEAFIYQGRQDGDNGLVKDFEVSFGNHPKVFGTPSAKGWLDWVSYEQIIDLDQPVTARYMKFTAQSQQRGNGTQFASASELGIIGNKVNASNLNVFPLIENGQYYLREKESGRFLRYVGGNWDDGNYVLGSTRPDNDNYKFTFEPVNEFTNYFHVKAGNGDDYMVQGENNWRVRTDRWRNDRTGWVAVEQVYDQGTQCSYVVLRGVWNGTNHQFGNFDKRDENSYIYFDKGDAAYFQVFPVSTGIDGIQEATKKDNAPFFNASGQRVKKDTHGIVLQNKKKYVNK